MVWRLFDSSSSFETPSVTLVSAFLDVSVVLRPSRLGLPVCRLLFEFRIPLKNKKLPRLCRFFYHEVGVGATITLVLTDYRSWTELRFYFFKFNLTFFYMFSNWIQCGSDRLAGFSLLLHSDSSFENHLFNLYITFPDFFHPESVLVLTVFYSDATFQCTSFDFYFFRSFSFCSWSSWARD